MKKKHSGIGYVRKTCYFCYHDIGNKNNRKSHHTPEAAQWN